MNSSKHINNKFKESDITINKKPASTLRKKLSAIDPTLPLDIEESYLEFSLKNRKEFQQKQSKKEEVYPKKDMYITPNNKIYRAKNHPQHGNQLQMIEKMSKAIKASSIYQKKQTQIRPRTSNTDKYQKSIDIIGLNHQNIKPQVRPGSSKSSRLFKKKTTVINDDMESDNIQDDSFIKITNRQKTFCHSPITKQRQRIGTSMSKKTRGIDKFQSKLDPQFFNLFAS